MALLNFHFVVQLNAANFRTRANKNLSQGNPQSKVPCILLYLASGEEWHWISKKKKKYLVFILPSRDLVGQSFGTDQKRSVSLK